MNALLFLALIIGFATFLVVVMADDTPMDFEDEKAPGTPETPEPATAAAQAVRPRRDEPAFYEHVGATRSEPTRLAERPAPREHPHTSPHVLDLRDKD